jgi:hypothetical protein
VKQEPSIVNPPRWSSLKVPVLLLFLVALWGGVFSPVLFGQKSLWEDAIQLEYPHRVFARHAILQGEFPHWTPYEFSGTPFFATQLPGVLYPGNILLSIAPVNENGLWYLIELFLLLHLLVAGFGMFLFVWKGKGLSSSAAMFAGVSYMLCGFLVCHQVHPMMVNIVAWVPLILYLLEKGVVQKRISFHLWAGIILGLSVLAGQPQITIYEFMFLGAYSIYLWLFRTERSLAVLGRIAVTFIIAGAIGSVQMLPAFELNRLSARSNWSFAQACEGSLSVGHLLTVFIPKLFGAWTGQAGDAVPPFWLNDSFHCGYYTYWETTAYAGIPILLLALYRVRRLRTDTLAAFAAAWGLVSCIFAMGDHTPFYKLIYDHVPVLGSFRNPSRIIFTWNVLLPVLAAYSFDDLRKGLLDKKAMWILCGAGCGAACIGGAAAGGLFAGLWPEMGIEIRAAYAAAQGRVLVLIGAAFAAAVFFSYKTKLRAPAAFLLVTVLIIDMVIFSYGHHLTDHTAVQYFNYNRNVARTLAEERTKEVFRSSMRQFIIEPDTPIIRQTSVMLLNKSQGLIDNIELVEGYSPLNLKHRLPPFRGRNFDRLLDLLNVKYYINPAYDKTSDELVLLNPDPLPRARVFHKMRVIADDVRKEEYLNSPDFDYRNELVLASPPSFPLENGDRTTDDTAVITSYKCNSMDLTVETGGNGLLWLSEIWYPLWRATVDGKPATILKADVSFRAIPVMKGKHRVSLRYHSTMFDVGAVAAVAALILSTAGLVFLSLRSRGTGGRRFLPLNIPFRQRQHL